MAGSMETHSVLTISSFSLTSSSLHILTSFSKVNVPPAPGVKSGLTPSLGRSRRVTRLYVAGREGRGAMSVGEGGRRAGLR